MSATDTYSSLYKAFRDRMLAYSPDAGATTLTILGYDVYQEDVPAGKTKYIILRIINDSSNNSEYGDRIVADLEVMVYSRPRSTRLDNRRASDLIDQAFKKFTVGSAGDGLLRVNSRDRSAVPQGSGDADPEVVQTRFLFHFFAWPIFLTSF